MPRGVRKNPIPAAVGQPRDPFKISDIKEEALITTITQRAGVKSDPEVTGFIKSVIPRFADWSANRAIRSMSNMAKEFGKIENGNENRATANGEEVQPRRRPGRPKGSKNKPISEKGQAANGRRGHPRA